MPTTPNNAAFLSAIQGMTVSGVDRHYDAPPESVDISAGECAFPLMPESNQGELLSSCVNMSKTRSIGYVIIIEAVGQGTNAQNYAKIAALMDNLETALDALTVSNFVDYGIGSTADYLIGGSAYWALVAQITMRSA